MTDTQPKPPTETHAGLAAFIAQEAGVNIPVEHVALVQRMYPAFLKSPAVTEAREARKAEREARKARQAAEKERRRLERIAAIKAELARLDGTEPPEPRTLFHTGGLPIADESNDEFQVVALSDDDDDDDLWTDDDVNEDEDEDY